MVLPATPEAALPAVPTVEPTGLPGMKPAHLARLTVVYKNELHPTISELEARAPQGGHKGKASSDDSIRFKRQGQWI